MADTISVGDVQYVASLAKIAITDKEAKRLTAELDAILGYVRQLDAVDTKGLEPTYQVTGLANVTRPDKPVDYGVNRTDLLKNAPSHQDGYIKVPKVL